MREAHITRRGTSFYLLIFIEKIINRKIEHSLPVIPLGLQGKKHQPFSACRNVFFIPPSAGSSGLFPRRITVSTCGIKAGLRELGDSGLAFLAVSLHAPNQELRAKIMPKAANWHLDDLMATLENYPLKTREHITFEYLLLGGVNDQPEHARELAKLVSRGKGKLNLIVYNPSEGDPYKAPSPERVLAFEQYLWDRNITAIIRKSKGQDIKAACGQHKAARQHEVGEQA